MKSLYEYKIKLMDDWKLKNFKEKITIKFKIYSILYQITFFAIVYSYNKI
jgi:hypothetical protein